MLLVGEDPRKHISDYSNQFQRDFLQLLKTAHGEKKVHVNHFYQEYIANKTHVHMNATRWPSLSEFAKYLGREGICRVEDNEKGLHISWIDNSPEALRRLDAIRKKERQDKGDEEREQKLIKEQIEKAEYDAEEKGGDSEDEEMRMLQRKEGEKITLNFNIKHKDENGNSVPAPNQVEDSVEKGPEVDEASQTSPPAPTPTAPAEKVSLKMSANNKPKNVFSSASKKSALGATQMKPKEAPKKPLTQAEKIMKQELEQKRVRDANSSGSRQFKRQKVWWIACDGDIWHVT